MSNFVKLALENGGSIHPLIIPSTYLNGPALTNASVYNDNGKILVNLRNINYTLYHSEKKIYNNHWGPLVYIHPENDMHLRTNNIICELDENLRIKTYNRVDTSELDKDPLWDFVGLEDARIVRWNGILYICGVRRDTTTNGEGRMELSELKMYEGKITEVARFRIPLPRDAESYCEKNWMPVTNLPYHLIKWTNGTELVKYDIHTGKTDTVVIKNFMDLGTADLRGGSQVIPFDDGYFCLNHETYLLRSETDRKDAVYRHRFVVWDKDWNIIKVSRVFSFLEGSIEFAVGMCEYGNDYLISFGFQDNAAYLVKISKKFVRDFIFEQ